MKHAIVFAAVLGLFSPAVFAQNPTDSLIGKTIHLYVEDESFNRFWFDNASETAGLLTSTRKYEHTLVISSANLSNRLQQDFFFRSDGGTNSGSYGFKLGSKGLNKDESRFPISVFQGHDEIWIILDPDKPLMGTPPIILFEPPKRVSVLNPWPTTGPKLVSGTKQRKMSIAEGYCGWFTTLILDPTFNKFHLVEINDIAGETYGRSGRGSVDDFDVTADFTSKGPHIWLNTQTNVWSAAWPTGVLGDCQYMMAATIRDFSAAHPDFQFDGLTGDFLLPGVVQNTISPTRKPVLSNPVPTKPPVTFSQFNDWWTTDTSASIAANLRRSEVCYDLPMSKSKDGMWEYDSYRDGLNHGFWPLDELKHNYHKETMASCYVKPPPDSTNWVTNGPARNGNFCMESHASFVYQAGQKFDFRGDDDVWVFINDKLVVDVGGVHTPKSASVDLDKLSLTPGKEYKWDLFYCDRQACGSSLRVKTSIYFKQQRALDTTITKQGNSTVIEIYKLEGGQGSCSSIGTELKRIPPANLIFQLVDANGKVIDTLKAGSSYNDGIQITPPKVTVNAEVIRDLSPGRYTIISFEAANEKLKVAIPFVVPTRNFVEFDPPYAVDSLVTALVPVVVSNREGATLVPTAEKYTLEYLTAATGIKVYTDKAKTTPAPTTANGLSTETTGYDTLWVAGDPTATVAQTITLNTKGSSKRVTITFTPPPPIIVEVQAPYTVNVPVTQVVAVPAAAFQKGAPLAAATPYTLQASAGAKIFTDAALAAAASTAPNGLTTEDSGFDTLYVVGDPNAFTDQVVTVGTVGSTKKVTITFQLPPVVLPKVISAGVYDDNGDGIGDRIAITYDSNLNAKTPKSVSYAWPADAAPTAIAAAGIPPLLDATGKILTAPNLALSAKPQTAGNGNVVTTFFVRGKDTSLTAVLSDKMAPMILKAEAKQGPSGDTLYITFSEPIGIAGVTAPAGELFIYRTSADGAPVALPPTSLKWTDGNVTAVLIYAPGTTSPQPGQQVRIAEGPGRIADAAGNGVGPSSRYRTITGVKRTGLSSFTLLRGPRPDVSTQNAVVISREAVGSDVKVVAQEKGRLGHLIQIDLGDYAVKDDFTSITPADVHLKWEVAFYDNTGRYLNRAQGDLQCTDKDVFGGDCTLSQYRGHLFIGWNLKAEDGSMAGTGVYIARIKYKAFAGPNVVAEMDKDQRWGYLRY